MRRGIVPGFLLMYALLCPALLHAAQFFLDTPSPGSFVSGLGFVAGWKCSGGTLTFSIDGGPQAPLVYKIIRGDTLSDCSDTDNGFLAQFNWNLLSTGQHTIRIYDNGSQFAQATFTVTTLGTEYLTGQSGSTTLLFAGKVVTLTWQENQQNFVITGASSPGPFSGTYQISATKSSDTCSLSQTGLTDTLTVTQNDSSLTGTFQAAPIVQYSGTVQASGNFTLTQTTPLQQTSGTCTFEVASSLSGNFNSGSVTVTLSRQQVSGTCPSNVNCDTSFSGTLTKTSALQSETSGSLPFGEGEGSPIDELIDALFE